MNWTEDRDGRSNSLCTTGVESQYIKTSYAGAVHKKVQSVPWI